MKFRFLLITEDYEVYGTNSEAVAIEAAESMVVVDVEGGKTLQAQECPAIDIPQQTMFTINGEQ